MEDDKNNAAASLQDPVAAGVVPEQALPGPRAGVRPLSEEKKATKSLHVLIKTVLIFYTLFLVVWVVFAWQGKRPLYSSGPVLRRVGESYQVEITLIREDREHLACASPHLFEGLHCGFTKPGSPWKDDAPTDAKLLRPYTTVEGEQLLASGLWSQLEAFVPLPSHRFSVLCSFHAVGAVRDAQARWNITAAFGPLNRVWFVGSLKDCVLPR